MQFQELQRNLLVVTRCWEFKKKLRGFMVSPPHKVWGEFFPKNAFHGGGTFLDKFMEGGGRGESKVVHWCVDGDVGS